MNVKLFSPFTVNFAFVTDLINETDRNKIKEYILNTAHKYSKNEALGVNDISSHEATNEFILDVFPELKNKIQYAVNEYCKQENKFEQKISNSWFNVQTSGGFTAPHRHTNSVYSGALYIESNPETQRIEWINPLEEFSGPDGVSSDCVPGELIIWPSHLVHFVKSFSEDRRIVISFNTRNV